MGARPILSHILLMYSSLASVNCLSFHCALGYHLDLIAMNFGGFIWLSDIVSTGHQCIIHNFCGLRRHLLPRACAALGLATCFLVDTKSICGFGRCFLPQRHIPILSIFCSSLADILGEMPSPRTAYSSVALLSSLLYLAGKRGTLVCLLFICC